MTGPPATPGCVADLTFHAEWDAGHLGCGELVMELHPQLLALAPGERLRLTARDEGAPEDLPAWCRLTRHRLVHADHPHYLIERRREP